MGLDQWLDRKGPEDTRVSEIYWRKANFVHEYFVWDLDREKYASDNCTDIEVDVKKLEKLEELCGIVLKDNSQAPYLLPTTPGFFFGSTEYGEWYFEDVKFTKEEIHKLLTERPLLEGEQFVYHAWY